MANIIQSALLSYQIFTIIHKYNFVDKKISISNRYKYECWFIANANFLILLKVWNESLIKH